MPLEPRYRLSAVLSGVGSGRLVLASQPSVQLAAQLAPFFRGPPGDAANISSDAENRLRAGSDGRLFVPELTADPVAYYILAKA